MDIILVVFTTLFCFFSIVLSYETIKNNKDSLRKVVLKDTYILHPNAITTGGILLAVCSMFLYYFQFTHLAIVVFIIAAFMDVLDGMVARATGLVTDVGKELDPFCDKIRYLLSLIYFAQIDILFNELVLFLVVVDVFGQLSRWIVDFANEHFGLNISIAANSFGKLKTVLALFLVVYCFLFLQKSGVLNLTNEILSVVFCSAILSVIFKFNKKASISKKIV